MKLRAKFHWHDNSQGEPLNIGRKTRSIPQGPVARSHGNVFAITSGNHKKGLNITPETSVPEWHGELMDDGLAVDMLLKCE